MFNIISKIKETEKGTYYLIRKGTEDESYRYIMKTNQEDVTGYIKDAEFELLCDFTIRMLNIEEDNAHDTTAGENGEELKILAISRFTRDDDSIELYDGEWDLDCEYFENDIEIN